VLEKSGPEPTPLQAKLWHALAACGPAGYGCEDALLLMLASKEPTLALFVFEGFGSAAVHLGAWIEALVRSSRILPWNCMPLGRTASSPATTPCCVR
jgi:hypothetical protein